ncbi:hypothetical protein GH714_043719 [Hevea brasiliensis]|uniref:Uncharacterized protein n=1 Tax=Hevea brasiliensis TaxID=3981 RepID=A0A6A6K377_HEVBR|nr:hypothetical protein GH714_043719 [Hevea brasiliensis]
MSLGGNKLEITSLKQSVDSENVSIIPIVGIGGIGKTTLAKLVYNDQRIATPFELKLWVCVSDVFELDKVIIKILNSASPGKRYMDMGIDQLQRTLREALNGRKYLLILDDVWSEDPRKWGELKTLLMGGANGSKILVTTRSQRVAEIMGTVSALNLSLLSPQDCLSLFFKCAFKGQQEKQNPNLKRIGEEIVRKCKGVPLAVITLGSLLYSVTDERKWELIRDNEIWKLEPKEDDILAALRLSYEHLPSYLKRCFAYCSIFPKDYEMDDIELVYLWIANGLVQCSNENQELEDIGLSYFKELCSRCFFQDFFEYGGNVKCQMHDLIHDLALSITQNERSMVRTSTQQIPKSVRHISFPDPESLPNDLPESLQNLDRVRTIWSLNDRHEGISSEVFIKKCVSRFQYMRVLDLTYSRHARPQNASKIVRLFCRSLTSLPQNIECLRELETLCIDECENLDLAMEEGEDNQFPTQFSLQKLELRNLPKLVEFPQWLIRLIRGSTNSLKVMKVEGCRNLRELPECLQNMASLPEVQIKDCPQLNNDPIRKAVADVAGPTTSMSEHWSLHVDISKSEVKLVTEQ